MKQESLIIIGGGAAALMAAIAAAETGASPILIERNDRPGKKLLITGKGRCNITNRCNLQEMIAAIPVNGRFLYGALSRFGAEETISFFEDYGLPLKTERGNRVFPQSDKASDVLNLLLRVCHNLGVTIKNERVMRLLTANGTVTGVETQNERLACNKAILCTGGASYPSTGSTGDGYKLAKEAGHTVVPLKPSLVALVSSADWRADLMGLSLRNVALSVFDNKQGRTIFEDFGELLFTHFGLSGPIVLSASSHIREMTPKRYCAYIDLKPALSAEQLDARLLRDFSAAANRNFGNALSSLLPQKMIPVFIRLSAIPRDIKVHQITREMRQEIIRLLKAFPVPISGFRPIEEAIITSGGVSVKEINPKTMESKLVKGLYFAGEIIDVDAYTGGFNLQIAWSTGRLAGLSAAQA